MAQREKEETELKVPGTLTLCANSCGLPGNPATKNLCQNCFSAALASKAAPPSCSKRRSSPARARDRAVRPDLAETGRSAGAEGEQEVKSDAAAPSRVVSRCSGCRRKVGLTGFRCRCGDLFCAEHRYSDRHDCSYDYKAAGRDAIARENPVFKAAKIVRI